MSEELEWELLDLFESRMFAFPIYEHTAARRIVRYLLLRGVPAEEIADAIADSPAELRAWLERAGRHMVGEWVIAWVNESRAEYKRTRLTTTRAWGDDVPHVGGADDREWSDDEDSDGTGMGGDDDDDDVFYGDMINPVVGSLRSLSSDGSGVGETATVDAGSPPPLPPRRPTSPTAPAAARADDDEVPDILDSVMTDVHVVATFSEEDFYDSGAPASEMYSCIDTRHVDEEAPPQPDTQTDTQTNADRQSNSCTCTLAHYSYIDALVPTFSVIDDDKNNDADHDIDCALYEGSKQTGYVCVWSPRNTHQAAGPYKVSTSNRPADTSDNDKRQLVWQVRVQRHLAAGDEVRRGLSEFCAPHSPEWFRCPLVNIVETLSKVAIKYRC